MSIFFFYATEAALSSQVGIDLRAASLLSNVELSATHTLYHADFGISGSSDGQVSGARVVQV